MLGSQQRERLQVGNYDTGGAAACFHVSKSTGNVWLPLTMGGDCSRWYLQERERERKKETQRKEGETESSECVVVFFYAFVHECFSRT